jgi:hypothetical protein
MSFEYLNADSAQRDSLNVPDIYYDPHYGASAALIDGGEWECALDRETGAFYPYVRRPVPDTRGLYDIVSPYGYGGVVGLSGSALADFRRRFFDDGRERGLVAEFLRTHPFDVGTDLGPLLIGTPRWHHTFGITVSDDPEEYFAKAEGRHRTSVRRALKDGLSIHQSPTHTLNDSESPFRKIYAETMQRVDANIRLRLGDTYFQALSDLGNEHVVVLEALSATGKPLAGATFLKWGSRLHYHLSGSTLDGQKAGATNLLIDYAIRNLCSSGYRLHLGGGVRTGDGLDRFKRSTATNQLAVAMCQTVVNDAEYQRLCRLAGISESDYFPAYRAVR